MMVTGELRDSDARLVDSFTSSKENTIEQIEVRFLEKKCSLFYCACKTKMKHKLFK
jgi:hypothetical protein